MSVCASSCVKAHCNDLSRSFHLLWAMQIWLEFSERLHNPLQDELGFCAG